MRDNPASNDSSARLLDLPDPFAQREDRLVVARDRVEERHHLLQQVRALDDGLDHRPHLRRERRDRIALDALGRVLDQVDDVVQVVGQPQDVLAVDRRLERPVGGDEDSARHGVRRGSR